MLETLDTVRTLQRKLYLKAKREPTFRFYALYDKVYRHDILEKAYRLVRSSNGSPGIDDVSFKMVEQGVGINQFLTELGKDLKEGTYKASPVMRVMIPKSDGGQRPLSIPIIKDRVAQMAVKLVIEPIFESDFVETSYGFRPKKGAHDAINEITHALLSGHTQVIDADLSKYFDTIPHAKLMKIVAERICDKGILKIIKMWLKAVIIEVDKRGKFYPHVQPAPKSVRKIKQAVKEVTGRTYTSIPMEDVIMLVNRKVRGWTNYFHYRNSSRRLSYVKNFVETRVTIHLRKRHKIRNYYRGFNLFPRRELYNKYGLYKIPTTAKWV